MSKIFSWLSQRGPTFEACILQLCPDMSAPRNIGSACAVSTFLSPKLTIVHMIRTKGSTAESGKKPESGKPWLQMFGDSFGCSSGFPAP